MELHPGIYNLFIDPLLSNSRKRIIANIPPGRKVIDIASGTGQLAAELSFKSEKVTGLELDESMVRFSRNRVNSKKLHFIQGDALHLENIQQNSFDIATLSMALHQFDPEHQVSILQGISRIAPEILLLDYSFPLPKGYKKSLVYIIERIAGKQHFRNFKSFMEMGGVQGIADANELIFNRIEVSGSGIFSLYSFSRD